MAWLPQQKDVGHVFILSLHPVKHHSKLLQDYSETNSLMPFSGDK
jgi:hypothetical protein